MIVALIAVPLVAAAVALLSPGPALRRALLVVTAVIHASLAVAACSSAPAPLEGWLGLDALGRLFLLTTSGIFLIVSVYTAGYLAREPSGRRADVLEPGFFSNAPDAIFIACLLGFLSTMTLVTLSQHFGILWVAVEGTTLASAPLIYFHRHHRSLEATWKYLLICSVGIAVALLGTFFLAVSRQLGDGGEGTMDLPSLVAAARGMNASWLRGAFLLMLVGYGTKMGLAPLHSWLPDAHSEAPSPVSALLSGALLNCALLGILRTLQVLDAAGQGAFGRGLLVVFGLLSMVVAAFFILGQTDYKRLLAYSSVEHMGIMALGIGIGGAAAGGSMLHLVNHSLAKALLFLVAGNTLAAYGTRSIADVRGVLTHRRLTGALWLAGMFAVVGAPPFGTFLSELVILRGSVDAGGLLVPALYLGALAIAFVGISSAVLRMVQGAAPASEPRSSAREPILAVAPPMVLAALVLLLGLHLPDTLLGIVTQAARSVGGRGF